MLKHHQKTLRTMVRWAALPLGALIFTLGAITFPLPLPTGIVLMVTGVTVAAFNPLVMRWLKRTRKRFPRTNARIRSITPHMPAFLQRVLKRTDSQHSQIK